MQCNVMYSYFVSMLCTNKYICSAFQSAIEQLHAATEQNIRTQTYSNGAVRCAGYYHIVFLINKIQKICRQFKNFPFHPGRRIREAFIKKKKKKDDICHLRGRGGVKNFQNVIFLKVVFKIHFRLF